MDLYNHQAERDVIGLVMTDPDQLYRIHRLRPDHFSDSSNRTIWSVIERMVEKGKRAEWPLVSAELKQQNLMDEVGGSGYVDSLILDCRSSSYALEDLTENLITFSGKRDFLWLARTLEAMTLEGATLDELTEKTQKGVLKISDSNVDSKPVDYHDGLVDTLEAILANHKTGDLPGITSGFAQMDDVTNGFKGGDLIVLGGRPSMGKSAFALHLARTSAEAGNPAAVLSYEMTVRQWIKRAMASACEIDHQVIERGPFSPEELIKLRVYIDSVKDLPLKLCPTFGYSLTQLGSLARRLKIECGLKLLIVDYLQLIRSTGKVERRDLEVGDMTRGLKQLALELDMPVIALSQLSRKLEHRESKRPMLSDLRDSGSVEQDADIVLFVHREEYYNPETPKRGEIEVIIAKNRSGSLGTIELLFRKSTQTFMEKAIGRSVA